MAKLKSTVEDPVEVPGPMREFYEKGADGKYHVSLDGESPKLAEFRNRNIELMKQAEADKAKLADLMARPDVTTQAAELEAQLAAERSAHAATQLKHIVTTEFLRAGGRSSAVDFMADAAAKVFAVEDGKVTRRVTRCERCGRSLNARHRRCLYCGQPMHADGAFEGV